MENIIIIKHLVVEPTQVLWYISNILEKIVEYMIHFYNIKKCNQIVKHSKMHCYSENVYIWHSWVFAHYNNIIWTSQWQFFLYSLDTRK
jgi:hypothetical protein